VAPLNHRFLIAPTLIIPPPPLTLIPTGHHSSNTETLITRATGPAALVGLLPADDDFRRRYPRRSYGATYPQSLPARPASGLSSSRP
jgi:hypothetical protein